MLIFYKKQSDRFTQRVEEKLAEMVAAHKIVEAKNLSDLPKSLSFEQLPALCTNHKTLTSAKAIIEHLDTLHQELKLSRSLQSDSCHLDPDNPDQCL